MTARRRPRSDLFRVCVSLLVTIVVAARAGGSAQESRGQ